MDKQYSVWGYIFIYKLMYSKMCENCNNGVTWDQAPFSFRFENNIPAGKAKRKSGSR